MLTSISKWINLSYTESFDNSTVKAEVINLGGLAADKAQVAPGTYTVEYSGDLNVIGENGNYVNNSEKTITFPAGTNVGVKVGSVLTLPADSQTPTPFAVVVDSVTENPDGSMTVKTHNAELYEVFEDVDVQYGGQLDLDDAVVYDMQGNRLSGGVESDNVIYVGGSELVSGAGAYAPEYLAKKASGTGSVKIGKFVDGLSYTVLGEDDPFYTFHYETDCGVVDACTRQTGETFAIEEGSAVELSSPDVCIAVGETYDKLMVRTVPKGYSAKDLVFTTEDAGIATAENLILGSAGSTKKVSVRKSSDGVNYSETKYKKYTGEGNKQTKITGNADGVTILKVSTKDGLYSAECRILVGNGGIAERSANAFIIEPYSIKLTPGASGVIQIKSAPDGYDMSQVTFTSSDTSVATVSGSGTVTAVGDGQAVITISTTDGAYTAMCMVFVSSAGSSV